MKTSTPALLLRTLVLGATLLSAGRALAQFPGVGDDTTSSLGSFRIVVNPTFQPMMAGYPGYNATSKRLDSPILFDPSTVIGRSAVHLHGDALDIGGLAVGTAGTIVADSNFFVQPPGFQGPNNTREVHTEVRSLNMTDGSGSAVRAGVMAPLRPISAGEVQSLSGPSGNPALDFPASSFFDIFVEVDLPMGGGVLSPFTLTNSQPLLVTNTNLTTFPPQVVYIHGNTTAVPVLFNNTTGQWNAGDVFGLLVLAGHGIDYTKGSNNPVGGDETAFNAIMAGVQEMPVDPQYATWAPGLTVASNPFPGRGDDVTTSLGSFKLVINPAYQPAFAAGPYPGYNPASKRLLSPLLYDGATRIGRSDPTNDASFGDTNGMLTGTTLPTVIKESSFKLIPPLFDGPPGTREVHTKVTFLNMTGGGAAVRAGSAAPTAPISPGEVESLGGPSGNTNWDFPAESFFDIFVQVDLPAGGGLPAVTITNGTPLIVKDNDLRSFPPKVIYVHGNSSAVPMIIRSSIGPYQAGDTLGILILSGHGINYGTNSQDETDFQQHIQQLPELPVNPQYINWAPNLVLAPQPLTITNFQVFPGFVLIEGSGTPNTTHYLTTSPQLQAFPIPWQTNSVTTSDQAGNFIFTYPIPPSMPQQFFQVTAPQ